MRLNAGWMIMTSLIRQVDEVYESLPLEQKDAFFEMVVYNVKGTALQNRRILNAQKSIAYGAQKREAVQPVMRQKPRKRKMKSTG